MATKTLGVGPQTPYLLVSSARAVPHTSDSRFVAPYGSKRLPLPRGGLGRPALEVGRPGGRRWCEPRREWTPQSPGRGAGSGRAAQGRGGEG